MKMPTNDFLACIHNKIIPPLPPQGSSPYGEEWPSCDNDIEKLFSARDECILHGMWAIVDQVWTKCLASWIGKRTCLEIMAGGGWLAKALHDHEVSILATDSGEWKGRHSKMECLFPVETLDGKSAVERYKDAEILIISWPPYGDNTICQICEAWGKERLIIYIGENYGGCNAPEEFWNRFVKINDVPDIPLMSWFSIHDSVHIGFYADGSIGKD